MLPEDKQFTDNYDKTKIKIKKPIFSTRITMFTSGGKKAIIKILVQKSEI